MRRNVPNSPNLNIYDGGGPPQWISENVNNSELDRAICTKVGGQVHHGNAQMTT